jgi:hypothetical protein
MLRFQAFYIPNLSAAFEPCSNPGQSPERNLQLELAVSIGLLAEGGLSSRTRDGVKIVIHDPSAHNHA